MSKDVTMEKVDYLLFHYWKATWTVEMAIEDLKGKFPWATIVKVEDKVLQPFRDNKYHFRVYVD